MSLSESRETVKDREAWRAAVHAGARGRTRVNKDDQEQLSTQGSVSLPKNQEELKSKGPKSKHM